MWALGLGLQLHDLLFFWTNGHNIPTYQLHDCFIWSTTVLIYSRLLGHYSPFYTHTPTWVWPHHLNKIEDKITCLINFDALLVEHPSNNLSVGIGESKSQRTVVGRRHGQHRALLIEHVHIGIPECFVTCSWIDDQPHWRASRSTTRAPR
jgi:hypothetical protein